MHSNDSLSVIQLLMKVYKHLKQRQICCFRLGNLIWNSNKTVVFKWTTEDIWMNHLSTHIVVEYNTLKAKLWFSCRSSLCLKCDVELVIWYEIPYNLREKFGSVSNIGLFDWVNINNYILLLFQHHCPHCIEC